MSGGETNAKSPHQILGTKPTDSRDEIKKQYRARVKQVHPDSTNTLDAETAREQFVAVQDAYEAISNGRVEARAAETTANTTVSNSQRYTAIHRDEFETFLDENVEWGHGTLSVGDSGEYIYDIPLPRAHLTIRIFSSVDRSTDYTRPCGTDAIRCVIWNHEVEEPVGGRVRTHRIETWRSNLLEKIQSLEENWNEYDRECPQCGSPLAIREGEYGAFYGCLSYPECDYTESVEEVGG